MPTKKSPQRVYCPAQSYSALERAISDLNANLTRLTTRLVGDEKLQTQGLIGEFSAIKSRIDAQESSIAKTAELLAKLEARMERQETETKSSTSGLEALKDEVEATKNQFLGGKKTISILVGVIATCGGFIAWVLKSWLNAKP